MSPLDKILVTGANGFIGKALVRRLRDEQWHVLPMTSSDGDLACADSLPNFVKTDVSHVIHLAGKTFVPNSWLDPFPFYQVNIMGTVNILEFCRKRKVPLTFVSAYIYGHPEALPIHEDSKIEPSNPYANTKWLAEQICSFYANTYGMNITTIRPFNTFGIGQSKNFLIPTIINQVIDNTVLSIAVNDLLPCRDYIYLDDVLSALIATINRPHVGYRVYNIGSGISLSVKEAVEVIQEIAGTNKEVVSDNVTRTNELMDVVADISRAQKELLWHPEHSFRMGIQKMLEK